MLYTPLLRAVDRQTIVLVRRSEGAGPELVAPVDKFLSPAPDGLSLLLCPCTYT